MLIARSTFAISALTLACTLPTAARAQSIPSPYEYIEPRQEVGLWSGITNSSTGRFGYGPDGGLFTGVRYGIELSGPISFEGVVGVLDSERDIVDPGRAEGDRVIGRDDVRVTTVEGRLRFTFPGRRMWHRLSPFFAAGAGIAIDASPSAELDEVLLPADRFDFGTSFYGNLGLGTRWFVTDRIALRGDWAFSLWKLDTPPGYADPERAFEAVSDGEWLWGSNFSIALLYRW